jgi:hypothetical protein
VLHHREKKKTLRLKDWALQTMFDAAILNVDEKITFEKALTPESFIQRAYCYSVFQKSAGYGAIPIDQFAFATLSATIDRSQIEKYRAWLDDKEGEACGKLVNMFSKGEPDRFDGKPEKRKFLLVINPLGALGGGLDKLKSFLATDINHERLHIIFAENKSVQRVVRQEWKRLSPTEKTNFKLTHPQYDFTDEDTVLREYFAYSNQDHPKNL